jgi:hypothetical protein
MREKLLWIVDKKKNSCGDEGEYKENRDFVHSLGLKCDCVGWCNYDLESDNADKILDKIEKYKEENHCYLRGYYKRTYPLQDSEWYKLQLKNVTSDFEENEKEIRAYKIPKNIHCVDNGGRSSMSLVSEEFRKACIEEQFSGVRFQWMEDIGKYKSQQYFSTHISNKVPHFYSSNNLSVRSKEDKMKLYKFGGKLPRLLTMFYDLDVELPICIKKTDLPDTDFSYYKYDTSRYVEMGLLIRKRVADTLLQRRLISKSDLIMINIVEEVPVEYEKYTSEELKWISEEDIKDSVEEYNKFLKLPRQERNINEKIALKILRKQKKEENEYFNKCLPKRIQEKLVGTIYETMIPYYKICDGGTLSEEYTLLSYEESIIETEEFQEVAKLEEWLEPIEGVLIAKGADGDAVVLTVEKQVKRISHEDYSIIEMWDNIESFIFDAF